MIKDLAKLEIFFILLHSKENLVNCITDIVSWVEMKINLPSI
jgi:hypothetical protein